MPLVSIITASHNSANTIGDTLLSVNEQIYPEIEHIVVDGGSQDDTMAIVRKLGRRVAKIRSELDGGIYDAFNKGVAMASGEVIGILNSDDIYASPRVISTVMTAFSDPLVDACHGDLIYVRQDNTGRVFRHWRSSKLTSRKLNLGIVPAHPTLFLRRSVYERIGGFDDRYGVAADYEFMLRALLKYNIRTEYMPEILVRMRSGGASGGAFGSILRQNRDVRAAQRAHGVSLSGMNFAVRKIADRTAQRLRARFVKVTVKSK